MKLMYPLNSCFVCFLVLCIHISSIPFLCQIRFLPPSNSPWPDVSYGISRVCGFVILREEERI